MSTVPALNNFRVNFARIVKTGEVSISEIARRAGTSRAYIHRVMDGGVDPQITTCEKLAAAIGQPLERLLKSPKNGVPTS